jgi:hypothetical protein
VQLKPKPGCLIQLNPDRLVERCHHNCHADESYLDQFQQMPKMRLACHDSGSSRVADFNADNLGDHIERRESARHAAGVLPLYDFRSHSRLLILGSLRWAAIEAARPRAQYWMRVVPEQPAERRQLQ